MSEKDEFEEMAEKLVHDLVSQVGWNAKYEFISKALRETDRKARIEELQGLRVSDEHVAMGKKCYVPVWEIERRLKELEEK